MTKIHIDIETYCELDLKKVGMYRYADHSSTEILCLAYAIDDKPVEIWREHTDVLLPESFIELLAQKDTILYAHNAAFERTLLNSDAGQRIGFPKTSVTKWRCTAAIAAYHSLPRDLKRCAQTLGVTQKDMKVQHQCLNCASPDGQVCVTRKHGGHMKKHKRTSKICTSTARLTSKSSAIFTLFWVSFP